MSDWFERGGPILTCIEDGWRVSAYTAVVLPQPAFRFEAWWPAEFLGGGADARERILSTPNAVTKRYNVKRKREPAYRSPFPETR